MLQSYLKSLHLTPTCAGRQHGVEVGEEQLLGAGRSGECSKCAQCRVDAFTECSAQSMDSGLCDLRAGNAAWMAAGCREGGRECRWRPRSPPCRCTATARSSDSPSNTYTADCFKYDTKYRSENAHTIPDCMLLVQECASRKDRAFRTLDVQSFTWHKA